MNSTTPLRIVIASSEAVPWSKTGGLADVSTALAKALSIAGHEVTLIVPFHEQTTFAQSHSEELHDTGISLKIPIASKTVTGKLWWTTLPGSAVRVVLVQQSDYFDRKGLYQDADGDYSDNCERFVFFSRAVIEASRCLVLRPDVIHANDWQTGLIPALLATEQRETPGFEKTGSVFTIHNMAFQGSFWHLDMPLTGMDWKYFNWTQMECHQRLNLLKTGIAFADQITTVSPTYAKEIQTPEVGCGLHSLLQHRSEQLTGILNGIDTETWNPQTDTHLAKNYGPDCFEEHKPACKAFLQGRLGLPQRADVPLFGMISRMTDQKGFDLIAETADAFLEEDVQIAVLGSGDSRYQSMFQNLSWRYPDKVAAFIGFDDPLAHQIEAGSDVYLMPSRFEPCGLNQMYSLAYGSIPLVRSVGGLADSVVDFNPRTGDRATGVVFNNYDGRSFFNAVRRSVDLYHEPESRRQVVRSGMKRDSSWLRSAEQYLSVYRRSQELRDAAPTQDTSSTQSAPPNHDGS